MYQKIIIVGNLGRDPEMRYMPDGTAVTNFSVATSRRWTDGATGEPREETIWFRVSVWRKQAETVNQYLSKGSKVLVEGRIRPDPNTGAPKLFTRQDGTVGASYDITADTVRFLSSRAEDSVYSGGDSSATGAPAQEEDDIPF
jgi:single-strand DNA-binding protein